MSNDVEPSPGDILYIEALSDEEATTIFLGGEFDLTGLVQFWARISQALATRPPSLTVQARRLTFIDLAGLRALIRAREAADEAGVAFRVRDPSPALRRMVQITGTEELLLAE